MELGFILLFLLSGASGFSKTWKVWQPNTNYDNPNNWEQGRIPKESDSIIFPVDLNLGVTFPGGELSLRQLVLPVNGEVFLPSRGQLRITGNRRDTGEDLIWKRRGAAAWLNPFNWRPLSINFDDLISVPHVERLPCSADTVVFPANSSFRVTLPEVAVPVGIVEMGNEELNADEWRTWLNTEPGYRQFIGPEENRATAVSIQELPMCEDRSGCVCGQPVSRSRARLMQDVCKYAQKHCAGETLCYSPIRPVGHCCDICGGYLTLDITAHEFEIEKLRQRVSQLMIGQYESVSSNVGRTSDAQAQIVLVDRSGKYDEVSVQLAGVLKEDLLENKLPGVTAVHVHTSGHKYLGSRFASATSTMFGTLFAVLLCMGLVYLLFVAYPSETRFDGLLNFREVTHPFRFARYRNLQSDGEGDALHVACEVTPDEDVEVVRQAFDNPLYGQAKDEPSSKTTTTAAASSAAAVGTEMERQVTVTNPIYSELQHKKPDDEMPVLTGDEDEEEDSETETIDPEKFDEIKFDEK